MYIHQNKKNIHLIKMIEIIESGKKPLSHDWNLNFLNSVGNYNKLDELENHN